MLPALAVRMGQEFDFDVLTHLLPIFVFEQRRFKLAQLGLGRPDEVLRVAFTQRLRKPAAGLPG